MAVLHVPMSEAADLIRALLAEATRLGLDPTTAVKTSSDGTFGFSLIVPDEVAQVVLGTPEPADPEPEEPAPKPAKKAAKKTVAKKAAEPVVEEEE